MKYKKKSSPPPFTMTGQKFYTYFCNLFHSHKLLAIADIITVLSSNKYLLAPLFIAPLTDYCTKPPHPVFILYKH